MLEIKSTTNWEFRHKEHWLGVDLTLQLADLQLQEVESLRN